MRVRACALLCLVWVGAPAAAAPITVLFQGTLSYVDDPFLLSWQGNLHAGDPYYFTIHFDDATAGTPDPSTGGVNYTIPAGEVVIQVGSFGYTGSYVTVQLIDDYQGAPADFVNLTGGVNAGPVSGGITVYAQGSSLLTSEDLAEVAWSALVGQPFTFTVYQFFPRPPALIETSVNGLISSVTLVPEPASTLWIAVGFVALRGARALRSRGSKAATPRLENRRP